MKVQFRENDVFKNLKDIFIIKETQALKIFYGGNGDLYFDVLCTFNQNNKTTTFSISNNDVIYDYFNELYNNILYCNVFNNLEINKKLLFEKANSKLVKNGVINWYSDSNYDKKANLLKIEKINKEIILTFFDNPEDFVLGFGIRFCNSGSKYYPFNVCFMNLYNELQNLYDKNDNFKKILTK